MIACLLCVLLMVIAPASLVPIPAAAQPSSTDQHGWTLPRTPDGQPDLQGVWANNTATPLQRPEAFAGREVLSDEELATLS